MASDRIAFALLAAGRATRFGGNKMEAMLGDQMLGTIIAATLAERHFVHRIAICNANTPDYCAALSRMNMTVIVNKTPERGLSSSLILVAQAALKTDATALLICLADMPYITAAHIDALIAAHNETREVIASSSEGTPMPPAIIPRSRWPDLLPLSGDRGAATLLQNAVQIRASSGELRDIDTMADWEAASNA